MKPVKAHEAEGRPRATIYIFSDGREEKWIGGSPAWRNNNPGNLRPAKAHPNQIGEAWGFAVFPDKESGKLAMSAQLRRPLYNNLSLEDAIRRYAPPSDNNPTEKYIDFVVKQSGVSRKEILAKITDNQLMSVINAMINFEKSIEGTIEQTSTPTKKGKYIWRTAQDAKVRNDHAERNGVTFDFADPPPGGNPGEDYNCRCWAEPIPDKSLNEIFKK